MSEDALTASLDSVRRLAIVKQHLAGPLPSRVTGDAMLSMVRDLAYVQWDPVAIVAPSHLLTFWARLGNFRPALLERLLWQEKALFEHWTPMASLVLTEDYPLYLSLMERYPESLTHSWGNHRAAAKRFLSGHSELRKKVLRELKKGPRSISEFEDHRAAKVDGSDWSSSSDVSLMLFHLLMRGEVMVVGHAGAQNLWGLSEEFLPDWVERKALSAEEAAREGAQRAIQALGTATQREVTLYFPRGRYEDAKGTLASLREESLIHRVTVEGGTAREERYVHHRDLALLESLEHDPVEPRLSLVPPFDNLVYSTERGQRLFGFNYIREQFLPKEKRRFGTYVLPIVWGERIIGRVDPRLDKKSGTLLIQAVHAEAGAPRDRKVAEEIGETISRLARFVGAEKVAYSSRVPSEWRSALH